MTPWKSTPFLWWSRVRHPFRQSASSKGRKASKPPHATRQTPRQQQGRRSEQLAAEFLRRRGYTIEAANVRFPVGELDIVAQQGDTLCLVEVRSHASQRFGPAAGSILARKQRHLIRAAEWYLQRRRPPWDGPIRFDVVAIDYDASDRPSIQLIPNAFTADAQ